MTNWTIKMEKHLKLCRKNLKSSRVVCCASCPFENIIISYDSSLASLFIDKRKSKGLPNLAEDNSCLVKHVENTNNFNYRCRAPNSKELGKK